jgi:peroxiredoxin
MRVLLSLFLLTSLCSVAQNLSGRRAPSFNLPDSHLQQHDTLDYRGRWLILNFIQTNCAPCKEVSKRLETVQTSHAGKVAVLSIVLSPPDTQQTASHYIAETRITSPILFDQGQVTITYFKATPQNPKFDVPHVFAVNASGMIVKDWPALAANSASLSAELNRMIAATASK